MLAAALVAAVAGAHALRGQPPEAEAASPRAWPAGPLVRVTPSFAPGFGVKRVLLDPRHGAENNRGNLSSFCVAEQDFTLATINTG